jgi:hypothetical protein
MFAAIARNCFKARGMYDLAAMVLSDQEIMAKLQAQQPPPGGQPGAPSPGGPPGGPPQPHPAIPTGQPTNTPGVRPPVRPPIGTPTQAAPGQ